MKQRGGVGRSRSGMGRTRGPSIDREIDRESSCFPNNSSNGYHTSEASSTSKSPVPSPCYRKSKCREDNDLTAGLWNNGEPDYLPGKQGGTWSKLLSYKSGLTTADRLHSTRQWMLVWACFSMSRQLPLNLNMKPARRALHRRRACVLQSQGLCFSRFPGNWGGWRGESQDLERFYSTQVWRNEPARQIACDMVCPVSSILVTADYHGFRYCVPMDGHRPSLDLMFYDNICPDQNGSSSRSVMTVFLFNAILSTKFPSSQSSPNMTSSGAMSQWMFWTTQINTWNLKAMRLKWWRINFMSITCVRLATMLDMCD